MTHSLSRKTAIKFIILLGFVSLFADMTYEGAKSITGQYLAILGASGIVVGFVAGFGEFIGYGFRLIFGYFSDKTQRYWCFTILGYAINLLAVPLIALAGNWPLAATLMILERFGKAVRSSAKDAMLSYATKEVGRGWGFGIHEAMDQTGAILGPLIVSFTLYHQGTYPFSFAILLIPALCALGVLFVAWRLYPRPQDLEITHIRIEGKGFTKIYWIYLLAISLVAAGYIDFPLIAYHFQKTDHLSVVWIPILFAIAMASAGISSLIFGKLYDRYGISILIYLTAISSLFVLLVFLPFFYTALFGMILWGIGIGAQESIMRAYVADLVSVKKRATAYGMLNLWFGTFWFMGSTFIGYLYDVSITYLIIFSLGIQLITLPLFYTVKKLEKKNTF